MTRITALLCLCIGTFTFTVSSAEPPTPQFSHQTLDDQVAIGYGVTVGDVDGDKKPDVLLADKKQFVWYRNGDWKKFVLAENLTKHDNVCIAARDIDGDGKVEIAVGAQWNPGNTSDPADSGSVHYLIRPADATQPWEAVQLTHEPTTHRMMWIEVSPKQFRLVVVPLHGRGNRDGQGAGVKVLAYEKPADARGTWKTQVIDESMHLTHNFDVAASPQPGYEWLLIGGKEGVLTTGYRDGQWQGKLHTDEAMQQGVGEMRAGTGINRPGPFEGLYATIEPMHGDKVVAYTVKRVPGDEENWDVKRHVLDDTFRQGHALGVADVLGIGRDQVIAGWRNPNAERKVGIRLYVPLDDSGANWKMHVIDDNEMACEDLKVADLNGDGKPDIVAAGRATNNLKIYWNQTGTSGR